LRVYAKLDGRECHCGDADETPAMAINCLGRVGAGHDSSSYDYGGRGRPVQCRNVEADDLLQRVSARSTRSCGAEYPRDASSSILAAPAADEAARKSSIMASFKPVPLVRVKDRLTDLMG